MSLGGLSPKEIAGKLMAFKGDDEVAESLVVIELTDVLAAGVIELAYSDRGERVYIQFRFADLAAAIVHKEPS
jgi:hypothetical protein